MKNTIQILKNKYEEKEVFNEKEEAISIIKKANSLKFSIFNGFDFKTSKIDKEEAILLIENLDFYDWIFFHFFNDKIVIEIYHAISKSSDYLTLYF